MNKAIKNLTLSSIQITFIGCTNQQAKRKGC